MKAEPVDYVCPNHRCDGHGWVQVRPDYADDRMPVVPQDVLDRLTDQDRERFERNLAAIRAALESSVYPCQVCEPELFMRWVHGHLDSDHDRGSCDDCNPKATRRATVTHAAPPEPKERKDLA